MNAPLEIEVKFFLPEVEAMRKSLIDIGARPSGRLFEANIRFENASRSLQRQGVLLRLRQDDRTRLTFKSTPSRPDPEFKVHKELEVEVADLHMCQAILEALGFHPEQTYEKWRETFVLDTTRLLIDTLPYGVFLEIEGDKHRIRDLANRLKLSWGRRILLNYLEIFEVIRREEGLVFRDVSFENFKTVKFDIRRYLPSLYAG